MNAAPATKIPFREESPMPPVVAGRACNISFLLGNVNSASAIAYLTDHAQTLGHRRSRHTLNGFTRT